MEVSVVVEAGVSVDVRGAVSIFHGADLMV
jgi:hypothetical protein